MISRYDFMKNSIKKDIDDEEYFDPLSISYNDVLLTESPYQKEISYPEICKKWLIMNNNYGIQYLDDILLNINGIPYIGFEKPGDFIYIIGNKDLIEFQNNKLVEND